MPNMNHAELRNMLESVKGTMFLSVQKLSERGKSKKVSVMVQKTLVGQTGFNYQNAVKNAFAKEGKQIDETRFGSRAWGTANANNTIIYYTNKDGVEQMYLKLRTLSVVKNNTHHWIDENGLLVPKVASKYFMNGQEVDYSVAEPHLKKSTPPAVQEGLDTFIAENDVRFDHIQWVRIKGIDYKVTTL